MQYQQGKQTCPGGKRSGAGRPKGEAMRKTRAIADRDALEGFTLLRSRRTTHLAADRVKDFVGAGADGRDGSNADHEN